jgi:hypothetical protein
MGEFSSGSTAVAERVALEPGLVLANRYEIKRPLGRGGMGEVWLAYDLRLRVEVALKALLPHGVRPESLHAEIRTAREVISPNVCRVFDLVEADGRELLSMEFVDGISLRQLLEERSPLDFFRAQEIAAQFLAGLEAIHAAGLVHRDFKPENVMLTRTGRVVVMDFGLARSLDGEPRSVSGTRPYMAPEQFLGRPVDRRSDVFAVSVVLAEMLEPAGVRDLQSRQRVWSSVRDDPPRLTDAPWTAVLRRGLARNPNERYDSAAAMARSLEDVRRRTGIIEEKSPYPGLGSFTEADAANFFGREAEVAEIWRSLSGPPRLLGVIGPSGAGKSSLMRAGVMAARPEGWRGVIMTPGPRPFASLASALAPDVAGDVEAVGALARLDESDVAARLFAGWRKRCSGALLIIDQFEELFTLSPAETQSRFASIVGRLPIESDVHVVLSMRDDFLIRCREQEDLTPVFAQLVPLQPLTGDALRRALVQPALNNGYRFEDEELVEEIVGQIAGERAALPLGAFAMARLWEKRERQNGMLTRAAYREIGAVGGALAQHAEATLGEIGVEKIGVVREVFRNLVTSHGTRASRERRELKSLFPEGDGGVIDALVNARLLTSYEEGRIEIVHESLLAAWPRLVQWQAQDADGVVMRDHLRQASELWEECGRAEEMVWSGNAYREYEVWRTRYPGALSTREDDFARAMESRARRSGRRKQLAVAAALVLAIAIAATFGVLWIRTMEASRLGEAQKLLALAEVELGKQFPTGALAYARKSLEIADTPEGRLRVVEILWRGPITRIVPLGSRGTSVAFLKFSPDGRWLIVTTGFGPPILLRSDGGLPRTFPGPPVTLGQTIKFSPDGRYVALQARGDPVLHVVHLDAAKPLREIPNSRGGFAIGDAIVTVTPTSSTEALVRSWPFTGGPPTLVGTIAIPKSFIEAHLTYGRADMREVALEPDTVMPDGSIVYAENRGVYRQRVGSARPELLWDVGEPLVRANAFEGGATLGVQTRNGIAVRLGDGTTRSLASSALGVESLVGPYDVRETRAALAARAAANGASAAAFWDLTTPSGNVTGLGTGEARDFTFDSGGRWLAASIASSNLSPIQLLSLDQPAPRIIAHTVGASASNTLMFAGDAGSIITCGYTGGFRRWRLAFPDQRAIEAPFDQCVAAAVAPDGRHAAAGFSDPFLISLLDGTARKLMDGGGEMFTGAAFDSTGEIVAASFRTSDPREPAIRVVDLRTGRVDDLMIRGGTAGDVPANSMAFGADGTLYTGGDGGIRRCNLAVKTCTTWRATNVAKIALSGNRRFLLAAMFKEGRGMGTSRGELVLFDLHTGTERAIPGFGTEMTHLAINHTGTTIAAIDRARTLTIAATTGDRRYVIPRAGSFVGGPSGLAISPDDEWVGTSIGPEIRLYPMPDLSQPPLHTVPLDELMSRLDAMTNARAVPDPASSTGYKLEAGPFPGWRKQPRWQ